MGEPPLEDGVSQDRVTLSCSTPATARFRGTEGLSERGWFEVNMCGLILSIV